MSGQSVSDPEERGKDIKELADELQKTNEVLLSVGKVLEERKENDDVLSEIKSECKKVAKELFGTTGDQNPMRVLENTTVRQVLDQISLQLNALVSKGLSSARFVSENGVPSIGFGKHECTLEEIRSNTDVEEQRHLQERFDDTLSNLAEIKDGVSMKARTISSIEASLNSGYSLGVIIENYLDEDMVELKKTWVPRSTLNMPQLIKAGTREVLTMSNNTSPQIGIFSYFFRTHNLRLVVSLQEDSLAIGLAPADFPMGNNIFNFDSLNGFWTNNWATMSDKRWVKGNGSAQKFVLWNGDLYANVEFKGGRNSKVEIKIAKVCTNPSRDSGRVKRPLSSENIEDGETVLGKTVDGILEYHLDACGVVMEICNLLQASLNEVSCFLENRKTPLVLPQLVPGCTREAVTIKFDCAASQGVTGVAPLADLPKMSAEAAEAIAQKPVIPEQATTPKGEDSVLIHKHRRQGAGNVFGGASASFTFGPTVLEGFPPTFGTKNNSSSIASASTTAPMTQAMLTGLKDEMKDATPESIFLSHKTKLIPGYSEKQKAGLVTFRIGGTDLRLAVAFQLFYHGNRFTAAFVPANVLANASTMSFLTNDNQWKTSPDLKYAYARDGEQVIQSRNIRASVQMTEGFKAVINVAIKAI